PGRRPSEPPPPRQFCPAGPARSRPSSPRLPASPQILALRDAPRHLLGEGGDAPLVVTAGHERGGPRILEAGRPRRDVVHRGDRISLRVEDVDLVVAGRWIR